MRVAASVSAGALFFLLLSLAGVDPELGRPRQQTLVVMLGSRAEASSPGVTAPAQPLPAYEAGRPVETVVPDIEHYEGVGDYYREEVVVHHGAGEPDHDDAGAESDADDEEGDEDKVADDEDGDDEDADGEQSDVDDLDDIDDLDDAEEKRSSPRGKAEGHGGG